MWRSCAFTAQPLALARCDFDFSRQWPCRLLARSASLGDIPDLDVFLAISRGRGSATRAPAEQGRARGGNRPDELNYGANILERVTNHSQARANQWRLSSLGFTIRNSR